MSRDELTIDQHMVMSLDRIADTLDDYMEMSLAELSAQYQLILVESGSQKIEGILKPVFELMERIKRDRSTRDYS